MSFGDLTRKANPDKILHDEAFNFANNPKNDRYQGCLISMVYNVFDKKAAGASVKIEKYDKPRIS